MSLDAYDGEGHSAEIAECVTWEDSCWVPVYIFALAKGRGRGENGKGRRKERKAKGRTNYDRRMPKKQLRVES